MTVHHVRYAHVHISIAISNACLCMLQTERNFYSGSLVVHCIFNIVSKPSDFKKQQMFTSVNEHIVYTMCAHNAKIATQSEVSQTLMSWTRKKTVITDMSNTVTGDEYRTHQTDLTRWLQTTQDCWVGVVVNIIRINPCRFSDIYFSFRLQCLYHLNVKICISRPTDVEHWWWRMKCSFVCWENLPCS